ncbi:MAG: hypothetical protein H6R18_240 [Proteobacteria bacterium]|nr:hypothetical protein [Pseudomonadota bacterium]
MSGKSAGAADILSVLILESETRECERLLQALQSGGHTVFARYAFNPSELAAALCEDQRWSIILLNCNLENLPATETLDTIRVADPTVPVILILDRDSKFLPSGLLESGAQDFVLKSNLSRLLPVVERECANGLLRRDSEKTVQAVRDAADAFGESKARFLQLAGNIPQCFWLVDAATLQFTYISPGYEQIWGESVNKLYADPADWLRPVHADDREKLENALHLRRMGGLDEKFRVVRSDGRLRWLHARNFAIRDDDGHVVSIGGIADDITSFVADQSQVAHLALFDALTALPNQIAFYDRLQNLLNISRRKGMRLAVMIIDIDRFHVINETLGHVAGDELLRQVAGRLSGVVREGDTVGRLGGDVFAAILADTAEVDQAELVARRAIETLALPVQVEGHEVFATASVGIAFYPQHGEERHELVRNAELAMRRAKEDGRNNVELYAPDLQEAMRDQLFLEVDLRNAVVRGEFILHYQPRLCCHSGRVQGVEALLRWQHPSRGLITPEQFLPLLEETGLVLPVGRWVLIKACEQVAAWHKAGVDVPVVSVNLSARQLHSETLFDDVVAALSASGLQASMLELELTESMLMQQHATKVMHTLARLKELGVGLVLDGFGTGYSSLVQLRRFPIDAVKVDRSFVQDITAGDNDASLTRAIINLAHSLKLKVVAVGVESEGQLALLISHGCDAFQGYFYSRALPVSQLEMTLAGRHGLPPHLQKPVKRQPTVLLAGFEGQQEVLAMLEPLPCHAVAVDGVAAALEWLAANWPDVIVCGSPRQDFAALELLQEARRRYPECECFLLADSCVWNSVAEATNTGDIDHLLRLPLLPEHLCRLLQQALARRQVALEFADLAEAAALSARELVRLEESRMHLEAENRLLHLRNRSGYAILQAVVGELPWPVLGVDREGMLALVNEVAQELFADRWPVLGTSLQAMLPEAPQQGGSGRLVVRDTPYRAWWREVVIGGEIYGYLLFLQKDEL